MRYLFKRATTIEDILRALGRTDIPTTSVVIRQPAVDMATGEHLADIEIDFVDYTLPVPDKAKLETLMQQRGYFTK